MSRLRGPSDRLNITVLGYVIRGPLGGMVWSDLQYLKGLRDLGHEVWFIEDSDDYPSCYNPLSMETTVDPSFGLEFAANVFRKIGFEERWSYYDAHTQQWHGPASGKVMSLFGSSDLLLNLAGVNPIRPWMEGIPKRVLVDKDPVFTQVRHLQDSSAFATAQRHTHFFSFGELIGQENCRVPSDALTWQPTRLRFSWRAYLSSRQRQMHPSPR